MNQASTVLEDKTTQFKNGDTVTFARGAHKGLSGQVEKQYVDNGCSVYVLASGHLISEHNILELIRTRDSNSGQKDTNG